MIKKKKPLSIILIFAMCLLTACGQGSTGGDGSGGSDGGGRTGFFGGGNSGGNNGGKSSNASQTGNMIDGVPIWEVEGREPDPGGFNEDGTYRAPECDRFIGIKYVRADENHWELDALCLGDTVLDCGTNFKRLIFDQDAYKRISYEEAFIKYYDEIKPYEEEMGKAVGITAMIAEGDSFENYREVFERILKATIGEGKLDWCFEPYSRFTDPVVETSEERYHSNDPEQIAKREREEEELRRLEEEQRRLEAEREEEERRARERAFEEWLHSPVTSMADIVERMQQSEETNFELGADVSLDTSLIPQGGIFLNCNGHSVTISGNFTTIPEGSDDRVWNGVQLEGVSHVDLSGLYIDRSMFVDEDWVGRGFEFVAVRNSPGVTAVFPEGYANRRDPGSFDDVPPFEGFICTEMDESGWGGISYQGPMVTYEAQAEQDSKVAEAILTNGDAYDLFDEWHNSENNIWTDVELNLGSVSLPNQDYMDIRLRPGASLTVTGTIAVTGGRLCFEVCEANQLNLNGLTLVKKHPSPDMVKITYNPSAGLNTSLLQPKAASGKIMFDLSSNAYCITIW